MTKTLRTPILAKCGLAKCGQHFETLILARCGLAKCGHENDLAKFVFFWPNAVLAKCGLAKCGHDRLVVLASEVGGRWSVETVQFITALSQSLPSSEVGWQLHGPAGGVQCLRASLPEPSLCLCWTDAPCRALVPSAQEVLRDDRFSKFGEDHVFCAWTLTTLILSISSVQKKTFVLQFANRAYLNFHDVKQLPTRIPQKS